MRALLITILIGLGFVSVAYSETNDYPKASWAFAGYASPDSALESWTWAFSEGDRKVMLQSLTPEAQKVWEKQLAGMTDDQLKTKATLGAAKMTGYVIRIREVVSDAEVIMHITMTGSDQVQKMHVKKVGNEWKVAGPKGD